MSNGVVIAKKTVVILLPEFTEPGISVNRPDIVVFKCLGGKQTLVFEELNRKPILHTIWKNTIELATLNILGIVGTYESVYLLRVSRRFATAISITHQFDPQSERA